MQARIDATLRDVEWAEGSRVLLAVGTGSRARGSRRATEIGLARALPLRIAYLGALPPRDTIEHPIVGGLDLGGWDLRRASALLLRSDAPALEWLASPSICRRADGVAAGLAGVARFAAHRPALEWHQDRSAGARHSALGPLADGEPTRLEAPFYAPPPALTLVCCAEASRRRRYICPRSRPTSRYGRNRWKRSRRCGRPKRSGQGPTRRRVARRWKPSYPRCWRPVRGIQDFGTRRPPPSPRPAPCSYKW